MHYAAICPTAYLEQYAGRGHFQLCLAQVAMRDAKYFNWYRSRRAAGDFVILDNGAYEGELVTFDELVRVAQELKPQVMTVPDKINDSSESSRLARAFVDFYAKHRDVSVKLMRVYQNSDREYGTWYDMITADMRTHWWEWVAFPRVLGYQRPYLAEWARKHFPMAKVHAFGWTGNLNEVRQLASAGVTSIDTSAAVWRGIHDLHLGNENVEAWEKNGPKFDPAWGEIFSDLAPAVKEIIESNLAAMKRACVAF